MVSLVHWTTTETHTVRGTAIPFVPGDITVVFVQFFLPSRIRKTTAVLSIPAPASSLLNLSVAVSVRRHAIPNRRFATTMRWSSWHPDTPIPHRPATANRNSQFAMDFCFHDSYRPKQQSHYGTSTSGMDGGCNASASSRRNCVVRSGP